MFKIKARKPAAALLTGRALAALESSAGLVPADPAHAIDSTWREIARIDAELATPDTSRCTPACADTGCSPRTHHTRLAVATYTPYTGRGYSADPFDK